MTDWVLTAAVALPLGVGLVLAAVAVLVLKAGAERAYHRVFAALYFLSGLKSVAEGLLHSLGNGVAVADALHARAPLFPSAAGWRVAAAVAALLLPALLVLFILQFPRPAGLLARRPWLGLALFLPSLAIGAPLLAWSFGVLSLARGTALLLQEAFNALVVAATVFAAVELLRKRRAARDPIERRQIGYLTLGFVPSFVATWLLVPLGFTGGDWARASESAVGGILPALELAACGLVAYAILKYRVLDLEIRVKGGAKYLLMTLFTGTILFVAVLYVENYVLQDRLFSFAGKAGSAALSGLTGMLLFKPIEKVSTRITDRLFPDTTAAAYARRRAMDVYHAQVSYVLRDRHVTGREWEFLRNLRGQLGLAEEDAMRVEQEVEEILGVDSPHTGIPETAQT